MLKCVEENGKMISVREYILKDIKTDYYNSNHLFVDLKKLSLTEIMNILLKSRAGWCKDNKDKIIRNLNILLLSEKMKQMDQKINDISDKLNIIIDALTLMDQVKSNS